MRVDRNTFKLGKKTNIALQTARSNFTQLPIRDPSIAKVELG